MKGLVHEILAAWREAERVISEHPPGSPEHEAAQVACADLRALYARLAGSAAAAAEDAARAAMRSVAGQDKGQGSSD